MTTLIVIISSFVFITLFTGLALLCRWLYPKAFPLTKDVFDAKYKLNWKSAYALLIALLFILFSIIAPFLLTQHAPNSDFNFTATGQIGDTIGGLMNPFIALAGVIVTGLAFYMQYKANLLQRELFEEDLSESKKQFQKQLQVQEEQVKFQ